MPIGGFIMSQFFESPLVLFNLIQVPQILPGNEELGGVLMSMHRIAGPTFFFIILAHIAGALWHHFIDKDETLKRMLPGGGKRSEERRVGKECGLGGGSDWLWKNVRSVDCGLDAAAE